MAKYSADIDRFVSQARSFAQHLYRLRDFEKELREIEFSFLVRAAAQDPSLKDIPLQRYFPIALFLELDDGDGELLLANLTRAVSQVLEAEKCRVVWIGRPVHGSSPYFITLFGEDDQPGTAAAHEKKLARVRRKVISRLKEVMHDHRVVTVASKVVNVIVIAAIGSQLWVSGVPNGNLNPGNAAVLLLCQLKNVTEIAKNIIQLLQNSNQTQIREEADQAADTPGAGERPRNTASDTELSELIQTLQARVRTLEANPDLKKLQQRIEELESRMRMRDVQRGSEPGKDDLREGIIDTIKGMDLTELEKLKIWLKPEPDDPDSVASESEEHPEWITQPSEPPVGKVSSGEPDVQKGSKKPGGKQTKPQATPG